MTNKDLVHSYKQGKLVQRFGRCLTLEVKVRKRNGRFYFEVIERDKKLNLSNCLILGETRSMRASVRHGSDVLYSKFVVFFLGSM